MTDDFPPLCSKKSNNIESNISTSENGAVIRLEVFRSEAEKKLPSFLIFNS